MRLVYNLFQLLWPIGKFHANLVSGTMEEKVVSTRAVVYFLIRGGWLV